MSAPTTHDPLVVNTTDGAVWTRRALTREGRGLYAVADAPKYCPEFVMATLAELAEHGIASSADALPMPVGRKPLALTEQQIDALAEAGNRVVNDAVHEDLCMCDVWPEKCLSSGNFHMGDWDMSGLESALPAVIALWESMRSDVLTESLRAAEAYAAQLEARLVAVEKTPFSLGEDRPVDEDPIALTPKAEAAADRLTRPLAPVQAPREDEPTADFFQPERIYQRKRWQFQCLAVAPMPHTGEMAAVGFLSREDGTATAHTMHSDDWAHGEWIAVESGGAV